MRFLLCLTIVLAIARPVRAEKLALGDVHGEADVADEAGAVTLLVRSALVGPDRTLLGAPPGFRVADPASLAKVGADHAVAMELSREGTGLRVTIVIVSAEPKEDPDVSYVRAGDGDLQALAKGISERITSRLKLEPGKVPGGSLGQLRPFAQAIRLKPKDAAAAATALADIVTRTTPPAAQVALQGLPELASPAPLSVIAARAIGDVAKLDAIGAGTDGTAAAARAFAAIHRVELSAADQALATAPAKDGLVALARVIVAEARADDRALADRIKEGLSTDQQRAILAFVSTITPKRIDPAVHRTLVALAEKTAETSPGVATRIGLAAAELGVEVTRSLALVTVRELDDADLERLTPFLAKDDASPTILRLKAELAMRRGDGSEAVAIAAFGRAAEADPRALRYQAWQLRAEGRNVEAAAAFEKAGANRERARALLAANDVKAAIVALAGSGAGSPEALVIEARSALAEKQLAAAKAKIDQAELEAPANPVVHGAVLDLVQQQPDPARAKISRLVVEKGTSIKIVTDPGPTEIDLGSGSGEATVGLDKPMPIDIDARPLEPLVKQLTGLAKLEQAKIMLVEQRFTPSVFSFRTVHAGAVRDGLTKILQAPPYVLRVATSTTPLPDGAIDRTVLTSQIGNADALLLYRVEPAGGLANVRLLLHVKAATTASAVEREIDMPSAVGLNTVKIWVVAISGTIVILLLVLWLTRAMGRVKVEVERTADITDDAFCIQFSKVPERPPIENEAEFFTQTKQAGAITKRQSATLFANGQVFKVPAGKWFVHLYGVYVRGGKYRKVADTYTQTVELRRGDFKSISFDLTSKLAEVRVVIESNPKSGHAVWANDDEAKQVLTDEAGEAVLMLPIGAHTIHIDAMGHRMKKQIQIASIKIERLPFNVARELRIAGDADLAHGDAPVAASRPVPVGELEPEPEPDPVSGIKIRTGPKVTSGVAADRTMPVGAETGAAMRAPRPGAKQGDMLLGRYRIMAELGRGAMGIVRRAWDENLEREVAIKEMAEDLRSNPEAMRLFTQEAKALAQLNHTNIVAMYDQVTDTDRVYMIMEFVDGQPLEAMLAERERLPWLEAVGIIDQVLAGLAYAHARKVIHRDIKPANIFVARDGVVKIGDFGLARVLREVTIRRTEIRGTPLYMAPEQITGTDVDSRADLYAVGCTLFELVTGRPPHVEGDILYAQLHAAAPAPSTLVPDLPASFDALMAKLIAKKANDRFASANDVRDALRKLA